MLHENLKLSITKMFLEKITVVAEGFSLSDFNRQFVINFSTHETKGLASIFSLNSREF